MKEIQFVVICFMCSILIAMLLFIKDIEKEMKELKELKMTMDVVESQIKLLTPPPEFFMLPEVVKK